MGQWGRHEGDEPGRGAPDVLETALWVRGQKASEGTKDGPGEGGEGGTDTGARSKAKAWAGDRPRRGGPGMLGSLQDTGTEIPRQESTERGGSDNRCTSPGL